jgi:hypothetical protein
MHAGKKHPFLGGKVPIPIMFWEVWFSGKSHCTEKGTNMSTLQTCSLESIICSMGCMPQMRRKNKMKDYEIEMAEKRAEDEATRILAFLQNIDDIDEATRFLRTWLKAVNAEHAVHAEPEIDDVLFRTAIAQTDRRFWDTDEMGDQE